MKLKSTAYWTKWWSIPLAINTPFIPPGGLYNKITTEQDYLGTIWLNQYTNAEIPGGDIVFADVQSGEHFLTSYGLLPTVNKRVLVYDRLVFNAEYYFI